MQSHDPYGRRKHDFRSCWSQQLSDRQCRLVRCDSLLACSRANLNYLRTGSPLACANGRAQPQAADRPLLLQDPWRMPAEPAEQTRLR